MRSGFTGTTALLIGAAVLIALAVAIRGFFLIILAAAAVTVVVLHFWNQRPVRTAEDERVRLNLDAATARKNLNPETPRNTEDN